MANIMGEVAKLLGVKLNEPFNVVINEADKVYFKGAPFHIDKNGFKADNRPGDGAWIFNGLLRGEYVVEPMIEKRYSEKYKLCYIENNLMYFTDNIEQVHGDDWNDAPYEHNATPPFNEYVREIIAYEPTWEITQACDRASYCILDVNRGAVPWLFHRSAGGLMGGTSYPDTITWLRKAGIQWGELHC